MAKKQKPSSILDRLAVFVSQDSTRPNLMHVVVEAHRAWATDGHRAHILGHTQGLPPGCYLDGVRIISASEMKMPNIDDVMPDAETPVRHTISAAILADIRELVALVRPRTEISLKLGTDGASVVVGGRFTCCLDDAPQAKLNINLCYLLEALDDLDVIDEFEIRAESATGPQRIDRAGNIAVIMPKL